MYAEPVSRSFLAGSLPLTFALSQSRLRLVATIGMGVLVGTALIVIIPEGVETLYSASDYGSDTHTRRELAPHVVGRPVEASRPIVQREAPTEHPSINMNSLNDDGKDPFGAMPGPVIPAGMDPADVAADAPPRTPTTPGKIGMLQENHHPKLPVDATSSATPSSHDAAPSKHEPHAWIGISLILGFILMYILDTLPFLASPAATRPQTNIYSLSELSSTPPPPVAVSPQRSLSTTFGLCIHAAADGIALGASSTSTSTTSLSLIIFVAIMVHKAPAAFGLTSVLLKQGLGKRGARAHLVVFSLAAPAGAICTWILVRALGGGGSSEPASMRWWTGVLLLFSGGTFL